MCAVKQPKSTRQGKGWCVSWVSPAGFFSSCWTRATSKMGGGCEFLWDHRFGVWKARGTQYHPHAEFDFNDGSQDLGRRGSTMIRHWRSGTPAEHSNQVGCYFCHVLDCYLVPAKDGVMPANERGPLDRQKWVTRADNTILRVLNPFPALVCTQPNGLALLFSSSNPFLFKIPQYYLGCRKKM